jgi:hypothetical protein
VTKTPARGAKKYKKVPLFGRVDKRRQPRPDISALKKAQWEDPEFRARHAEALKASHKANPTKHSRAGVPTGHTRESVAPLWERAEALADRFIKIMEDKGEIPTDEVVQVVTEDGVENVTVPGTEAGMAKAALKQAFVLAVGPVDRKIQIQAINTVLNFTKSKPESKSKLTLNKAEDFLDSILNDG